MASAILYHQVFSSFSHNPSGPKKDVDDPEIVYCEIEWKERIYAPLAAVSNLLNSYASEDVIANGASESELIMKYLNQAEVQFTEFPKKKALRCGNAFPKKRTNSIFADC